MKNRFMHEQLPIDEHNPIIARHYDYDRFTYPWHFHSVFEIIYVSEGYGERFVADRMEPFKAGDIILLGSNLPHYMRSKPECQSEENVNRVKGVVIQFHKNFMSYAINNYLDLKSVKALLEQSERGFLFSSPGNKEVIDLIKELPSLKGINRLTALLQLLDSMTKLKHKRLLASNQFNNSLPEYTDDRFEKILSYISYHYTEKIDLETVASKIPMNSTAFCRYFKEKSGKTFMDYIIDLRIGYACKLLSGEQMDISDICLASGFNSITHFNRVFKRKTQLTPTEYRKQFSDIYR